MARSLLSKASGAPVAKQSVHQEEFAKHLCHETLVSGVLPADMLSKRLVVEDLLSNATRLDALRVGGDTGTAPCSSYKEHGAVRRTADLLGLSITAHVDCMDGPAVLRSGGEPCAHWSGGVVFTVSSVEEKS